jgi:hypothetical protein
MKLLIPLCVLATLACFGATQKEPSNCSPRPCTYTITCADAVCTPGEVNEIQAALNDARRGDTIKLEAGRTFPIGSALLEITARPGSAGYLTITTTEDASLPSDPMVRITPHWLSKMPILRATSLRCIYLHGSTTPAEHVRIRGIIFDAQGQGAQQLTVGSPDEGLLGYVATSDAHQPDDIVIEHCIFRNKEWETKQAAYISLNTRSAVVRSNWIAGGRENGKEVQAITMKNGPGPADIHNNYLADTAGETIMHGGTGPGYRDFGPTGSMLFNAFINHPERMRGLRSMNGDWTSNTVVFKGRWVKGNGAWFIARNTGTTGVSAPSWPNSIGQTVNDNGVIWRLAHTSGTGIILKNLYETKNSRDILNAWNQYRGFTNQAQVQAVVYKLSNSPPGESTKSICVPAMSGKVNTNGTTVTSADGKALPNVHQPEIMYNVHPDRIEIGGVEYKIADFVLDDDNRIQLTTSAGVQTNVNYSYGDQAQNCYAAYNRNNRFIHNIVENSSMGIQVTQWGNGLVSRVGHLVVRDNLFRRIDCQTYGGCGGLGGSSFIWLSRLPPFTFFERNTIVDSKNATRAGLYFIGSRDAQGLRRVRGNIWPISAGNGVVGAEINTTDGDQTLKNHLCGIPNIPGDCTTSHWNANIIAGADKTKFTTGGSVRNLCSSGTGCSVDFDYDDPVHGKLFQHYSKDILKIRTGHYAFHGDTESTNIGADYQMLPVTRGASTSGEGPSVTATNNSAVFSYWVHAPLRNVSCSLELSTTREIDNLINVPDPNTLTDVYDRYPRNGLHRFITVSELSAGTTYWYRLHCGPVYEGSFSTDESSSPTRRIEVSFQASETANFRVIYGPSYSRSAGAVQSASYGDWVSCTAGQSCTVEAVPPAGISYYRVESQTGNKTRVKVAAL